MLDKVPVHDCVVRFENHLPQLILPILLFGPVSICREQRCKKAWKGFVNCLMGRPDHLVSDEHAARSPRHARASSCERDSRGSTFAFGGLLDVSELVFQRLLFGNEFANKLVLAELDILVGLSCGLYISKLSVVRVKLGFFRLATQRAGGQSWATGEAPIGGSQEGEPSLRRHAPACSGLFLDRARKEVKKIGK